MADRHSRFRGIEKLGRGLYRVRARTTDPRTGKERSIERKVKCKTKQEAARIRDGWVNEVLVGEQPDQPRKKTLRDYGNSWMRRRAARLRDTTADHYAWLLAKKIYPALGDLLVDTITRGDIEDMLAEGRKENSAETINGWLRLTKTIMKDAAYDYGFISPAEAVKPYPINPAERKRRDGMTARQLAVLLQYVREHDPEFLPILLVLAMTGMRWSEVAKLRWEDIDEQEGIIHLRRVKGRKQRFAPLVFMMPDGSLDTTLRDALREHRRRLIADQHPGLEAGWIFATVPKRGPNKGRARVRYSTSLTKKFKKWSAATNLGRKVSPQDLRRTWVDVSRGAGVDPTTRRGIVGHADEHIHDVYSTVRPAEAQAAGGRMLSLVTSSGESSGELVGGNEDARSTAEANRA